MKGDAEMDAAKMTESEIENHLIKIMANTDFFSLKLDRNKINRDTAIIKDLALDSIQLLEYMVAIEQELELNLDYQDLSIEVFESFGRLAGYFYTKINA